MSEGVLKVRRTRICTDTTLNETQDVKLPGVDREETEVRRDIRSSDTSVHCTVCSPKGKARVRRPTDSVTLRNGFSETRVKDSEKGPIPAPSSSSFPRLVLVAPYTLRLLRTLKV